MSPALVAHVPQTQDEGTTGLHPSLSQSKLNSGVQSHQLLPMTLNLKNSRKSLVSRNESTDNDSMPPLAIGQVRRMSDHGQSSSGAQERSHVQSAVVRAHLSKKVVAKQFEMPNLKELRLDGIRSPTHMPKRRPRKVRGGKKHNVIRIGRPGDVSSREGNDDVQENSGLVSPFKQDEPLIAKARGDLLHGEHD